MEVPGIFKRMDLQWEKIGRIWIIRLTVGCEHRTSLILAIIQYLEQLVFPVKVALIRINNLLLV